MKQIILLTLFSLSLCAETTFYIGTGYGYHNETYSDQNNVSHTNSANMIALKVGYGQREAYAIEFTTGYIANKDKLIDNSDAHKYDFSVDFIKAFDFDIYILPYLRAGIGTGLLKSDIDADGDLTYGTFNLGTGVFLPLSKHFDFEVGYNYKYLTYEKLHDESTYIPSTHVNIIYIGINARF